MVYLLTHAIVRSAERYPDSVAFRYSNQVLTYADLFHKMNQLAKLLIESGVKKGDRVGILLHRSMEAAIALYGIMNAGAIYVPLDPGAPVQRIQFTIEDCGIKHLISQPALAHVADRLISQGTKLATVIGITPGRLPITSVDWQEVWSLPTLQPSVNILENDLAYIMYTSGSTGNPKGMMHTHYSGLSYAKLSADLYGLNHEDKIGNHAPLHFDVSTFGYFTGPLVGASTVIVPEAHIKLPASLSQLMADEKLTVWYSVPLALIQLLQSDTLPQRDMSHLRWVLFAGEPFPTKHLRGLMQQWGHAKFSNIYGPAELNQCTYYHLFSPPQNDQPIPIGRAWGNTEILIIDENGSEVTAGAPGELLVRSATMMQGYWSRPDLNEKAFFKTEVVPGFQKIYYRTGDWVQLSEEGELMFLGRRDRQIKTRGYRVELDEVTAVLLSHEGVEEVAVVPFHDPSDVWMIEAFVILKAGSIAFTADQMKIYAGKLLPWYAVPQVINIVNALPRTSSGKIDFQQLQSKTGKNHL